MDTNVAGKQALDLSWPVIMTGRSYNYFEHCKSLLCLRLSKAIRKLITIPKNNLADFVDIYTRSELASLAHSLHLYLNT